MSTDLITGTRFAFARRDVVCEQVVDSIGNVDGGKRPIWRSRRPRRLSVRVRVDQLWDRAFATEYAYDELSIGEHGLDA